MLDLLTKREREVLMLIVDGHNEESVTHQLGININTVGSHYRSIAKKTCCNSWREIVVKYYQTYWEPKYCGLFLKESRDTRSM